MSGLYAALGVRPACTALPVHLCITHKTGAETRRVSPVPRNDLASKGCTPVAGSHLNGAIARAILQGRHPQQRGSLHCKDHPTATTEQQPHEEVYHVPSTEGGNSSALATSPPKTQTSSDISPNSPRIQSDSPAMIYPRHKRRQPKIQFLFLRRQTGRLRLRLQLLDMAKDI